MSSTRHVISLPRVDRKSAAVAMPLSTLNRAAKLLQIAREIIPPHCGSFEKIAAKLTCIASPFSSQRAARRPWLRMSEKARGESSAA
jgi:hypothetical protein